MKKQIPNLLTLLNLLSGGIGIIETFQSSLFHAAICIWLGAFFDLLDGLSARLLGTSSALGKQLDSLADLVTFGVLPSVIMYQLIQQGTPHPQLPWVALLITIFSALRLARFNNDEKQTTLFIGLPTPANAILISTLPPITLFSPHTFFIDFLSNPYALTGMVLVLSWLLVSNLKFVAFKFTTYAWHPNRLKYLFLLFVALLMLWVHVVEGLALSILAYIIVSSLFQKSLKRL